MAYDSPKTCRNRQRRAENKAARPRRTQPKKIKVMTDEQWDRVCGEHIAYIYERANFPDSVKRHAQFLVQAAIQRLASQIMFDFDLRDIWKAMVMARGELLGKEPVHGMD